MNKLFVIHGLILCLGVYFSDPFCQDCSYKDKEKSKSSLSKTVLKRADKIKNVIESLIIARSFDEKVQISCWLLKIVDYDVTIPVSSYLFSNQSIRAPPIV